MSKAILAAVLVVVCAAAYAAAQNPHPRCDMPSIWYARRLAFDPEEDMKYRNRTVAFFSRALFAYDDHSQRLRIVEDEDADGKSGKFDILQLYGDVRKAYAVDLATRECKTFDIPADQSFPYLGVPKGSTYTETNRIGAEGQDVYVSGYRIGERGVDELHLQYTDRECVPVAVDQFSKDYGFVTARYYDTGLGLPNNNIWDIPEECKTNLRA